ncbi:hypothetical protein QFX18_19285 [Saccharophagus degradans]|uniref:hypothetical protein n=1 Tax=Saccharophagus degradans TaxID=86304 RepID=UPI0024780E74|nr:hypothetical protein [Saccharophagus degradans]WGO98154.1 hypothetical protein QFX18_19285 [Saccharophagus degradans]
MFKIPYEFAGTEADLFEFKDFKAACYCLQNYGTIKVISTDPLRYPNNYYFATCSDYDGEFILLFNFYNKIIGYKRGLDDIEFIDKDSASNLLKEIDQSFTIPKASDLNEVIGKEHLSELAASDAKEVKFFSPANVGGALFSADYD